MDKLERIKEQIHKALVTHYQSSPIYFEILMEVPTLWNVSEWESTMYVVTTSRGETLLINEGLGFLYVDPQGIEFLKECMENYKEAMDVSTRAIELLKKAGKR